MDVGEGAAKTAKSPDGKAPPVLASQGASGGPGGQQYWIDQSGTVIGAMQYTAAHPVRLIVREVTDS